jgi:hypothetical protein
MRCLLLLGLVLYLPLRGLAESWQSVVTSNSLALQVYEPAKPSNPQRTVIYLKNLAAPRAGTEGDESIIRDLCASNFLVVTLDYAKDPKARVPFINRDLGALRDQLRAKKFLTGYNIDQSHIFIIPEGCRLLADVPFYHDASRTLAMDIIYPSKPVKPVGALIEFSCDNENRFGNVSLSICSDTILDAEATEGFAVAMADHPVRAPYKGLDAMPDCALKIKAAVRTLRAQAHELGLNGKIAPVGFSRGSGMALMLATTEGMAEFEGAGENIGTNSAVQGAVVMSGRFTYLDLLPDDHMLQRYDQAWGERETHSNIWREAGALDYLGKATVPMFLTINCSESPDALHQMTVLQKRLTELDSPFQFVLDPVPRGHKVPLVPEILTAMNNYLKRQLADAGVPKPLYRDPVYDGPTDPTVIWNPAERKWFMFYTSRRANVADIGNGVEWVHGTPIGIAESPDGEAWNYRGTADIHLTGTKLTFWAPEVIAHDGLYHMYLTVVPGIFSDWKHPRDIVHLTSSNLLRWEPASTLKLASERVIDPCVMRLADGSWRMWYNNEADKKSIYYADSTNLFEWQDKGKARGTSERGGEGPKVFRWKEAYWMVVDIWDGLRIYRSTNALTWVRQGEDILKIPGRGEDDGAKGHHCDVVVNNDRACVFYFTHPGEALTNQPVDLHEKRRSSIQVVELQYKNNVMVCDRDVPVSIKLTSR